MNTIKKRGTKISHLKKLLTALWISLVSNAVMAKPVNVVEIANFYCVECYNAQENQTLEKAVQLKGGVFDFVPLFLDSTTSWPSRVYFSLPDDETIKLKSKKALFNAAVLNGVSMKTAESTCVVVHDVNPDYSVAQCARRARSKIPNIHFERAQRLLHHIFKNPNEELMFPIFIIEQDNDIKAVMTRHQYPDVSTLVREVERYVNTLS